MKFVYKSLLTLFMGMALVSCAGTNSSAQKRGEEAPNLFKAGTPFADSLASTMPELARSVFKGTLDSVPGEYYYHTTDNRIDTLFKKEGGQYKPIVSIAYDFFVGQSDYELKKGSYSYFVKDDVLEGETCFPKYVKAYWNNGNTKVIATGTLYRDDQNTIWPDSGHLESYFENGKVLEQSDWKDKYVVSSKVWNENGALVRELNYPNYSKEYWDDGKPQKILTGLLYRDDQGVIQVDSGLSEIYFENGKIKEQNDWKGKQIVAHKEWNENGVLTKDINLPKYYKEYWDNGKLKGEIVGILYRNDQDIISADSGYSETYFENEKTHQHNEWRNKQIIAQKEWNENGALVKEIDFPKYTKEYWDNGNPKQVFTGLLYRLNNLCLFKPDSGHAEIYFESGKIKEQTEWKNKDGVASKVWNEDGVLIKDIDYPKHYKEYRDNGKPKAILTGLLYRDDKGNFDLDSGRSEEYFENGKIQRITDWKNKQQVAQKEWNEKGEMIKDLDLPKHAKIYWDNGKPKTIMTGHLYWDNQGAVQVDSGRIESYFENGKIQRITGWKDKQYISQKEWNEKGLLLTELDFPKSIKEYWVNGKLKQKATGILYRDDSNEQNCFAVDSGRSEIYFENGNISQQNNWKGKQPTTSKQWNESGALVRELDFPKSLKDYWDNGKLKAIMTGLIYRDNYGGFHLDSGHSETYFENGKIYQQNDWKDKQGIASKQWNENGVLVKEWNFPKYFKEYWNNGKLKMTMTGILYASDQGNFRLDSGHSEIYSENGEILSQSDWKDKQAIAEKVWNKSGVLIKELHLPNYVKVYWNNGNIKEIVTGALHIGKQGGISVDSGRSESYFENGKIQTQRDWKNDQIVAIKQWNEDGILTKEIVFPNYAKAYWENGKPKEILAGILYRNERGGFMVDSGRSEVYFENGKINQQNDWKSRQATASKQWNEDGVLIKELDFPKSIKEYWNDGKIKSMATGLLYINDQGKFMLDSGHSEIYFENGKINEQNDWKNKHLVASKTWNENGVLILDIELPRYHKEYWENGKIKSIAKGLLYRDDQGIFQLDSGRSEIYFENGKIHYQKKWKDKQLVAHKEWNENGTLIIELDLTKSIKEYWNNGKIKEIGTGLFYKDDQNNFHLDSGYSEAYFENGKISQQNDWKNKHLVANKTWNENGVLIADVDFPKYLKIYWDNGKPKNIMTGRLYSDNPGNFELDSGHQETYYENGQIEVLYDWKDKQLVAHKEWNEDGTVIREGDISKEFHKAYFTNGKTSVEVSGKFHYSDWNIILENATEKYWNENGTLTAEIVFPKHAKFYSDSGVLYTELEGTLYYGDQGEIKVQDGSEKWYRNGELNSLRIYKGKKLVSKKTWYNGTVDSEGDVARGFYKEYLSNGKVYKAISGKFHYDDNGYRDIIILENATEKRWNANGNLKKEIVFPKYVKEYSDNGTLVKELEGTLYYDEEKEIQVQNGFRKEYSDNGKLTSILIYGEKKLVGKTIWNENGNVSISVELPNRYREFYSNGKIKAEVNGILVEEDGSFRIKDGIYNEFDENGKVTYSALYKDFQKISER